MKRFTFVLLIVFSALVTAQIGRGASSETKKAGTQATSAMHKTSASGKKNVKATEDNASPPEREGENLKKYEDLSISSETGRTPIPKTTDRGVQYAPIPIVNTKRFNLPEYADFTYLDAALYDSGFIFNEKVRMAYFDHCLELVTPHLHFSPLTWVWLHTHPAVLNATFALEYPPNPNIIHNFVKLAKLVGPTYADKYEQLLIAFAVRYRGRRLLDGVTSESDRYGTTVNGRNFTWDPNFKARLEQKVGSQRGWAVNHDVTPRNNATHKDEIEQQQRERSLHSQFDLGGDNDAHRVVNWLKQNGKTMIYEIKGLSAQKFRERTGIQLSGNRAPGSLSWDKIAHVAGRYPPRTNGSITDNLCLRIMRYEEKGGGLFPLHKAPWPLLLLLTQEDPLDESTYWWSWYKSNGSVPGYATYSFDYSKPEIRFANGSWHPEATPRILTDGGVCGRLSKMAEFAQRSIGTPAQGMGQPGHRAFMTYQYNNGRYSVGQHHSVDTIEVSTAGWLLPPVYGPVTDPKTKVTGFAKLTPQNSSSQQRDNIRWHIGLCEAMNVGLERWEDSRMALHVLDLYTSGNEEWMNASRKQQEALLRSAFILNIANTDVVFRLAQIREGKASQILDLIQAFSNAFVTISEGCTGDTAMARNANFGNTTAGADLTQLMRNNFSNYGKRNFKKVTNEWALYVRNAIFLGSFTNIPEEAKCENRLEWHKAKGEYARAVNAELKYQKSLGNSPFLAAVQRLNDKYEKVSLAISKQTTRNPKEEQRRKQEEANSW